MSYQVERPITSGFLTHRSLNSDSPLNQHLVDEIINILGDRNNLFNEPLPEIATLDELLHYLTSLVIRFDTDPCMYQLEDYKVLVAIIVKALIHLYKNGGGGISGIIITDWQLTVSDSTVPSSKLVKDTIDLLLTAINNINSEITDIKSDITGIEGDITNILNNITNIESNITNIEGDITNIEEDITNINTEIIEVSEGCTYYPGDYITIDLNNYISTTYNYFNQCSTTPTITINSNPFLYYIADSNFNLTITPGNRTGNKVESKSILIHNSSATAITISIINSGTVGTILCDDDIITSIPANSYLEIYITLWHNYLVTVKDRLFSVATPTEYCIEYTGTSQVIPTVTSLFGATYIGNEYDSTTQSGKLLFDAEPLYIGNSAFISVSKLTSINIPNSIISIGNYAFNNCTNLTSAIIGINVTSIGSWAFSSCINLASMTIPNNVTSIDHSAFSNCSNLESITIGNSVTNVGHDAFAFCTNLTTINYTGTTSAWNAITFGTNWHTSVPATVVHCSDGDVNL